MFMGVKIRQERRDTDEFWNDIGFAYHGVRCLCGLLGSPDEIHEQDTVDACGQGISDQQGKGPGRIYSFYVSIYVLDRSRSTGDRAGRRAWAF